MSLIGFHRFLIVTAIIFCFGYGGWEFFAARDGGGLGAVALGVVFTVLGVGLTFYLVHLGRFLGFDEESAPQ